jgi:hypothetical protein
VSAADGIGSAGQPGIKPVAIPPQFPNIPAELKSLPKWVLWRYMPPRTPGLRAAFGRGILNVCDKTVQRMNLPTTYVGGVAYVDRDASLEIIGAGVRPRLQPRATDRDAKVA